MMHRTGGVVYVFCQIKRVFRPPSRGPLIFIFDVLVEVSLEVHSSKAKQRVAKQDTIVSVACLPDQGGDRALDNLIFILVVILSWGICNHNHWDAVLPSLLAERFFPFGPHGIEFTVHSPIGDHWYNKGCFLCCPRHHGEKRGLWRRVKTHTVQSTDLHTLSSVREAISSLKP